jgi:hypothetical protein
MEGQQIRWPGFSRVHRGYVAGDVHVRVDIALGARGGR